MWKLLAGKQKQMRYFHLVRKKVYKWKEIIGESKNVFKLIWLSHWTNLNVHKLNPFGYNHKQSFWNLKVVDFVVCDFF